MSSATRSRTPAVYVAPAAGFHHEFRSERRLCTLFRTGKLLSAAGETLCRVRNISSNGFMADVCPAPAPGDLISLQLSEGEAYEARTIWANPDRFGARFLASHSISELLNPAGRDPRHRQRALRLEPSGASVTIVQGGRASRGSIVNISQSGLAVFGCGVSPSMDGSRQLRMEIDGLDPMAGFLCWSRGEAVGIQFQEPLSFETLSHWLWAASLASTVPAVVRA